MRPASARRVQQNTRTQLLVKILQERKKAGGAIQGGRGLADGIAGREDERPLPGRLAEPGTGRDHSVIAFGEAAGRRDAEGAADLVRSRKKPSGRRNIARAEAATMLTTTAAVANPVDDRV